MTTGEFSGYTGDTLIHLANGTRKYMCDLEAGDELRLHDSSTIKISSIFSFEFEGFISLVAPGLTTTRYTILHDLTAHKDTTPLELNKPTLYYHGMLYNITIDTKLSSPVIIGSTSFGIYDFSHNPDNCLFVMFDKGNPGDKLMPSGIWQDPPGIITQRHPKPSAESTNT
jgi:hypothetical protein